MVLVFKTSVNNLQDAKFLQPCLDHLLHPAKWNFDLGDCDRILRVESVHASASDVISVLENNGFDCVELE